MSITNKKFSSNLFFPKSTFALAIITSIFLIPPNINGQSNQKEVTQIRDHSKIISKDTVINGNTVIGYIFYDRDGKRKLIKIANYPDGKSDFNDYSAFRDLNLKGLKKEINGDYECNLRNISFEERQHALKEVGVNSIPSEALKNATIIRHYTSGPPQILKTDSIGRFIAKGSYTEFVDMLNFQYASALYHLTILDYNGEIHKQLTLNNAGEVAISSTGDFLLLRSETVIPGDEFSFNKGPFYIYNLLRNATDTIALDKFSGQLVQEKMLELTFADSCFQMLISIGPKITHVFIDPYKKEIFSKTYLESDFQVNENGKYELISKHLPNVRSVRESNYLKEEY